MPNSTAASSAVRPPRRAGSAGPNAAADPTGARFDPVSGSWLERFIFTRRDWLLAAGVYLTFLLFAASGHLRPNGSFERMVPQDHPYIANFLAHRSDLPGGNSLRIAVAVKGDGTIYNATYLEVLRRINDDVFLLPGVDRAQMKSLWTPSTRWLGVTKTASKAAPSSRTVMTAPKPA